MHITGLDYRAGKPVGPLTQIRLATYMFSCPITLKYMFRSAFKSEPSTTAIDFQQLFMGSILTDPQSRARKSNIEKKDEGESLLKSVLMLM